MADPWTGPGQLLSMARSTSAQATGSSGECREMFSWHSRSKAAEGKFGEGPSIPFLLDWAVPSRARNIQNAQFLNKKRNSPKRRPQVAPDLPLRCQYNVVLTMCSTWNTSRVRSILTDSSSESQPQIMRASRDQLDSRSLRRLRRPVRPAQRRTALRSRQPTAARHRTSGRELFT